jgi:hypothetical protein
MPGSLGLSPGAIAGIVIGVLAGLGLVIGLTIFCTLRTTRAKKPEAGLAGRKEAAAIDPGEVAQEMPAMEYRDSLRRAEVPGGPLHYEMPAERDPAEMYAERSYSGRVELD